MKDMMSYKGFYGSVHYNDEDQVFHGKIEFIRSVVSYEGTGVESLRTAFQEAVDDYLRLCEQENKDPEKPFKGSFNVRTGADLHRRAVLYAKSRGTNLNTVITDALEKFLSSSEGSKGRLSDVEGWLDEDDPFFSIMDNIVAERKEHIPRMLRTGRKRGSDVSG
jgi:predicted HicB family RNase H-like nuclease